jgi:hypothetical protein
MGTVIPRAEEEPQRHKPLFPALGTDSAFRVSFTMLDRWTWEMPLSDVDLVTDEPTTDKSVETLLDLMETYINDLAGDDPPPNVIVIPLPEDIEETCTHPDNSREE